MPADTDFIQISRGIIEIAAHTKCFGISQIHIYGEGTGEKCFEPLLLGSFPHPDGSNYPESDDRRRLWTSSVAHLKVRMQQRISSLYLPSFSQIEPLPYGKCAWREFED